MRETLRKKLETTFKDIWDTPHAFQYLARSIFLPYPHSLISLHSRFEKLKNVLHIEDMESKHKRMINCFKVEMERLVQKLKTTKIYSFAGSPNSSKNALTGSPNSSRDSKGCHQSPGWVFGFVSTTKLVMHDLMTPLKSGCCEDKQLQNIFATPKTSLISKKSLSVPFKRSG